MTDGPRNVLRSATPLVLVAVAAAALLYTYFVDRGRPSDLDREARSGAVFPSFSIDLVRRVELTHGPEVLVLEREERKKDLWIMTSPRREPADPGAVEALLRSLEQAKQLRTVSSGTPLGELRMQGKTVVGEIQYSFALLGDAPYAQGGAYMTLEGHQPFVVDSSLKAQLLRSADAYRIRALVPYGQSKVERLERTGGPQRWTLGRDGATFRLDGGRGLRVARSTVDRIFEALADLRVDQFVDDAVAENANAHLALSFAMTPIDSTLPRVELDIGGPCPTLPGQLVVTRIGPVRTSACVARGSLDSLDVTPAELVDEQLLFARADEIEEVDLLSTGSDALHVNIARKASGWQLRAPAERELNSDEADAASALVTAMAGATAVHAETAPSSQTVPPKARATFGTRGGGTEALDVGSADSAGLVSAKRLQDGAVLRLSRSVARSFEPRPIAFRSRQIWTGPFDAANVVSMDDTCPPQPERIELRDGRWVMRSPPGLPLDAGYAMDVVEMLAHARADRWIAESDDGTFGLGSGACRVTLTLASGELDAAPVSRRIVFGATAEGGTYARTLDDPGVFLAPLSIRERAEHPAIDRSGFRVEASQGMRAIVSHDGASRVFVAVDGKWVRLGDAGAASDRLAAALPSFHASDAMHAGPPEPGEGFNRPTFEIEVTGHAEDASASARRIAVGAATGQNDNSFFARVSGVDATFVVERRTVEALLSAW